MAGRAEWQVCCAQVGLESLSDDDVSKPSPDVTEPSHQYPAHRPSEMTWMCLFPSKYKKLNELFQPFWPCCYITHGIFFKFISGGGFKVLSRRDVIIPGLFSRVSEVGRLKKAHTHTKQTLSRTSAHLKLLWKRAVMKTDGRLGPPLNRTLYNCRLLTAARALGLRLN